MAFPTSPVENQEYNNWIYQSGKWNKFDNKNKTKQDRLYTITINKASGATASTQSILRQFIDVANWSNSLTVIEIYSSMYETSIEDYGMYVARWGFSSAPGVVTKISSNGATPYWGTAVTISGNYQYRDLLIDLPTYRDYTIRISTTSYLVNSASIGSGFSNAIYIF